MRLQVFRYSFISTEITFATAYKVILHVKIDMFINIRSEITLHIQN